MYTLKLFNLCRAAVCCPQMDPLFVQALQTRKGRWQRLLHGFWTFCTSSDFSNRPDSVVGTEWNSFGCVFHVIPKPFLFRFFLHDLHIHYNYRIWRLATGHVWQCLCTHSILQFLGYAFPVLLFVGFRNSRYITKEIKESLSVGIGPTTRKVNCDKVGYFKGKFIVFLSWGTDK